MKLVLDTSCKRTEQRDTLLGHQGSFGSLGIRHSPEYDAKQMVVGDQRLGSDQGVHLMPPLEKETPLQSVCQR